MNRQQRRDVMSGKSSRNELYDSTLFILSTNGVSTTKLENKTLFLNNVPYISDKTFYNSTVQCNTIAVTTKIPYPVIPPNLPEIIVVNLENVCETINSGNNSSSSAFFHTTMRLIQNSHALALGGTTFTSADYTDSIYHISELPDIRNSTNKKILNKHGTEWHLSVLDPNEIDDSKFLEYFNFDFFCSILTPKI